MKKSLSLLMAVAAFAIGSTLCSCGGGGGNSTPSEAAKFLSNKYLQINRQGTNGTTFAIGTPIGLNTLSCSFQFGTGHAYSGILTVVDASPGGDSNLEFERMTVRLSINSSAVSDDPEWAVFVGLSQSFDAIIPIDGFDIDLEFSNTFSSSTYEGLASGTGLFSANDKEANGNTAQSTKTDPITGETITVFEPVRIQGNLPSSYCRLSTQRLFTGNN